MQLRILFKRLDPKEGIMSMTPKFKIGDRVVTYDKVTGEVTGIHINTFADASKNDVTYMLKNLTRPKIGQTLIGSSILRDERDLTLVPEPVVYEVPVRFSATEASSSCPMSQAEADDFVRGWQRVFDGSYGYDPKLYNVDFGKPAPVKTARELEGEYWAEYYGMGTE